MTKLTTIPLHMETRDKLKMFGTKGDTYDDILRRLMGTVRYEEFMESQYKRLDEKEKFAPLEEL